VTEERQLELRQQIDRRFDQFSLDEVSAADSGEMTLRLAFPNLSLAERQFAERYRSMVSAGKRWPLGRVGQKINPRARKRFLELIRSPRAGSDNLARG
jgi:hypothetical protein